MTYVLTRVDVGPDDLPGQLPLKLTLLRQLPGPDRPDYWLAKPNRPIRWTESNRSITHVVVSTRFIGASLDRHTRRVCVGLAYVTNDSLLEDPVLDFGKCRYVAVCDARRASL